MSTRSAIIIQVGPKNYQGIYCHFDGYPEHHGPILLAHYSDADKVARLVALGDISILDERVEPIGAHTFAAPEEGTVVAYGRDRGETGIEPKTGRTIREVEKQIGHNGHVYVFRGGKWTHNGRALKGAV